MSVFFIDFEASSLSTDSYPIEVAWVGEDGRGESYLIRPEPDWCDWSPASQSIHGITRAHLQRDGHEAVWVANRLITVLGDPAARVYSDVPGHDQMWLDELLAASSSAPRIPLRDVYEAYAAACRPLHAVLAGDDLVATARQLVAAAQVEEERRQRVHHRALEDAMSLWRTWADVRRRAEERAAGTN
ncbi:Transcriptional regulator (plasmid) [Rhodovastum atsumiense]|uniref:Transcriptional regulator n=1 Tax=Rhodovastum atsumiense TaxID=504468 RepID=A0A5M6IUE9_9PROT|nr:transcriptional regulator [Rhodovastum atsumiense]KAA5611861.1 transcriptional regulator [Rhodovastum atsumiense]CAH2606161.1 Transcriptional regulator [Rhodovastum atsumiense]